MPPPCDNPRDAALAVVNTLRAAGHTAYLAGGCVRDALLGLAPKDYDVATDATPDTVQSLFRSTAAVGAAFGVVLVYIPKPGKGRHTIEVATFRAEGAYSDGRRPDEIRFTTAEEDAKRRDFTINGLFADPPPENAPAGTPDTVIDFVGGQADLKQGVIRAIGEPSARFGEDYLRMLRAVRFAARLGFEIEPNTAEAIRHHAPKLDQIARERIGDEVRRMLSMPPPAPAAVTATLNRLGLTLVILGVSRQAAADSILQRLEAGSDYATRLVAWFAELDWPVLGKAIQLSRKSLMLSNEEYDAAKATRQLWLDLGNRWEDATTALRKRWSSQPRYTQALLLLRGDAPESAERVDDDVRSLTNDGIGLAPPPLVTGDDLIALGLKPGPNFKTILDNTYDAQLEGRVTTHDQALAFAQGQASE